MEYTPKTDGGQDAVSYVKRLLTAYRDGDELAFDELVILYRPLLDHALSEYAGKLEQTYEKEDVAQYVWIAFSRAALTYRLEQEHVSFGLYASVCIHNSLTSRMRQGSRRHVQILPIDGINEMADPSDLSGEVIERETVGRLYHMMGRTLSSFEYEVMRRLAAGDHAAQIAQALGKSEKSVNNAIFRARKKLKSVLNGTNL